MKCPDCASEIVVKPEIVVQKEPCKCGVTDEVRMLRLVVLGFLGFFLAALGGCWISSYYTTEAIKCNPKVVQQGSDPWPKPVIVEEKK